MIVRVPKYFIPSNRFAQKEFKQLLREELRYIAKDVQDNLTPESKNPLFLKHKILFNEVAEQFICDDCKVTELPASETVALRVPEHDKTLEMFQNVFGTDVKYEPLSRDAHGKTINEELY